MQEPPIHLLLIDEDADDARQIGALLARQEEQLFDIVVAVDLPNALDLLQQQRFDLILIDFSLTGAAGLQGFYYVRAQAGQTPIVLLTQHEDQNLAMQALAKGAQDFIVKGKIGPLQLVRSLQFAIVRHQRLINVRGDLGDTTIIEPTSTTERNQQLATDYGLLTLERLIGEGASSTVFLASTENPNLPSSVAIKLLKTRATETKEACDSWRRIFQRECGLATELNHDNVVRVFGCGMTQRGNHRIPFILMEYVEGRAIEEAAERLAAMDIRQKVRLLVQISHGLQAIHDANIRHGDIKPGNILLTEDDRIKISDFGISGRLLESTQTLDSPLIGSPAYMPPEALARSELDGRSDLFSLGVLAYEMLLNQRPFQGKIIERLSKQIRFNRPVEPRKIDHDFPDPLQRILARCLRKVPDDRYDSAAQLAGDLEAWLDDREPPLAPAASRILSWGSKDWA